jgi:hypothetical protein
MNLEILTGLNVFKRTEFEKAASWYAVCLHVCMNVSLAPERLNGFYSYSIFESLSIISRCSVNMDIPSLKILALQMGIKTQNYGFLKKGCNDFDSISVTYGAQYTPLSFPDAKCQFCRKLFDRF